jgi:hypothetical protein
MQKTNFFTFFSHNLPIGTMVHHHQSKKLNFLLKYCVKVLFCWYYFSPLSTFMKNEGSGAGSASAHLTNGSASGSGRPKNMRILRIRIRFRIRIPNSVFIAGLLLLTLSLHSFHILLSPFSSLLSFSHFQLLP